MFLIEHDHEVSSFYHRFDEDITVLQDDIEACGQSDDTDCDCCGCRRAFW